MVAEPLASQVVSELIAFWRGDAERGKLASELLLLLVASSEARYVIPGCKAYAQA